MQGKKYLDPDQSIREEVLRPPKDEELVVVIRWNVESSQISLDTLGPQVPPEVITQLLEAGHEMMEEYALQEEEDKKIEKTYVN